jgi:hydrogenase nickel incorporation protein HypA/HybF
MHEETYTQAILDLAFKEADGRQITEIRLGIGRFSAIVPASVEVFFRHLSKGTSAQGARLNFKTIPVELTCSGCGKMSALDIDLDVPVRPALAAALNKGCRCGEKKLKITGGLGCDLIGLTVV